MERPSRSRWPAGLLGMLAMVAMVESTLARHPLRFTETASLSWKLAIEAIPREARRCEVACLGDSLVKIGVIPEVIRAEWGRSTYNFAMAQAPAPATYFMLRRLIEAGGRPSAIVVNFKPSVLAGGPRFSLRHWQTMLDLRESLELARETRSVGLLVEIGLGRLLPSYRDRLEIRESVHSALLGETAPTFSTNRLALRNWGINQGAHLNSARTTFPGDVGPEIHKKLLSDAWKCHRINATFVDRLLALAEARQIPVFWLIPPLPPQLQAHREQSGVDAAYLAFVRSMQAKHPGLTVVDGRHSGYDDSTFADHTHLNGRGSIAMSRDLGSILDQVEGQPRQSHSKEAGGAKLPPSQPSPARGEGFFLAPSPLAGEGWGGGAMDRGSTIEQPWRPRWVNLPRFADRPGAFPVEDVDQSRVALETEATRR